MHQSQAQHGNDNALSHDPINEAIDDGNFNFEIQDLKRISIEEEESLEIWDGLRTWNL